MKQMTIGQRIAAKRKLNNLSQEALADQLEVSRQAVSKWESDGAIPEIDKLIALGKIFDVSVGWILGTEETSVLEEGSYGEEQTQILKELAERTKPTRKLPRIAAALAAFAVAAAALWGIAGLMDKVELLSEEQSNLRSELAELSESGKHTDDRIDAVSDTIEALSQERRILTDVNVQGWLNEDMTELTMTLYLTPKLHLEGYQPYLSIENPLNGYNELLSLQWNGVQYWIRHTLPPTDGYRFDFLLVSDYGYQMENLNRYDDGLSLLGAYSSFHRNPAADQQNPSGSYEAVIVPVMNLTPSERSAEDRTYRFDQAVHTPHIFSKTAVAYQNITAQLRLNGVELWSESYLDEFERLLQGTANRLNAADRGLKLDLEVALPELNGGDRLELVLTAETVNGGAPSQKYYALLDVQEVAGE